MLTTDPTLPAGELDSSAPSKSLYRFVDRTRHGRVVRSSSRIGVGSAIATFLVAWTTAGIWGQTTIGFSKEPDYPRDPASSVQEGVPQGKVTQHELLDSQVYPGTRRRFSVYVPAQYRKDQPAALMVFQDGHAYENVKGDFRVPVVFDNLIASGEMPVTIAVMVDPGFRGDLPAKRGWSPRPQNRSVEYDSVNGDYAKFLIEEILPMVSEQYRMTDNPQLRAIGGSSSGGICAFSVAWHRPDSFGKVLSNIGSFVDLRGGHNYPPMIRKADRKPIRVFLQDGSNDLDNQFGNWPLANQQMAKALAFKDYDYQFVFGPGAHNGKHAGSVFPDALRWLWRDWKEQTP